MKESIKKGITEYLIQFSIIVLSIMMSFFLNEWRSNLSNRQIEIELLEGFQENLTLDSLNLKRQIFAVDYFIRGCDSLLFYETVEDIGDSLFYWMDGAISYSKMNFAEVAYEEMKQSKTIFIKNKDLQKKIVKLYTLYYSMIEEWNGIDKNFILNQMIPYMDEHFPYVPDNHYEILIDKDPKLLMKLLKEDHFRNLINNNKIFKQAHKQIYAANRQAISKMQEAIREELKRIK